MGLFSGKKKDADNSPGSFDDALIQTYRHIYKESKRLAKDGLVLLAFNPVVAGFSFFEAFSNMNNEFGIAFTAAGTATGLIGVAVAKRREKDIALMNKAEEKIRELEALRRRDPEGLR